MQQASPSAAVQQQLQQEKQLNESAEQQLIDDICLRHKVPFVYKMQVPTDDSFTNFATAWFKQPSRSALSISMSLEERDPLQGKEIILRDAFLEGDNVIDDLELFLSACTQVDKLTKVRLAVLKKNLKSGQ